MNAQKKSWQHYQYRDADLKTLRREHGLTGVQLAEILCCEERTVYQYLSGSLRFPDSRWRLLMLELGLERPAWTPQKRAKRMVEEYVG